MSNLNDYPVALLLVSGFALYYAAILGIWLQKRIRPLLAEQRPDFDLIRNAAFTLLALLVGFCLSMVVSRYDQRKVLEEAEANAIGTEYARVDLVEARFRPDLREALKAYTAHRIDFYRSRAKDPTAAFETLDTRQHSILWASATTATQDRTDAVAGLVLAGMNDVINSQGFTQAAWRNRLPQEAWGLMFMVALMSNLLMGFGAIRPRKLYLAVVPFVVSVSLFLIADIDSPGLGLVRISPENLLSVLSTME